MMIMNKATVMGTMMGRMTPTTTIPIIRMITTTNQLHQTQRRDPLHARSQLYALYLPTLYRLTNGGNMHLYSKNSSIDKEEGPYLH